MINSLLEDEMIETTEKLKIKFRDATIKDLKEIQKIERLCFKYPYPTYYMRALLETLADTAIVAEIENEIIGYIFARVEIGNIGHIISIAVHPQWRKRGIGTALMLEAMSKLKSLGCSLVYLEVRISNYSAIKLYKKLGFRIVKRLKRYYRDGEDAYKMERKI